MSLLCSNMAEESNSDVTMIETPSKPDLKLLQNNSVEVQWKLPESTGTCVQEFEIAYKESAKRNFRTINRNACDTKTVIPSLKPGMKYLFKIRALNLEDDEVSDWSDKSEISIASNEVVATASSFEKTFSINDTIPSAPICYENDGSHSLTLIWQKPSAYRGRINCYDVFYKEGTNKPCTLRTENDSIIYKVNKLKQNCSYTFRVRAVTKTDYADEFSELSVESLIANTNVSIAYHLIKDESTVEMKRDTYTNTFLYKLKSFQVGQNDILNNIRQVYVGRGRDLGDGLDKRYVLLFGKAGSGKSTIIDLMVNHVYDVGWEDNFRLTAIDKMSDEIDIDEHLSQTQWITCYEMKRKENSMLPYDLVIIDTPGFQKDNEAEIERLKVRFKAFFKSGRLPGLHAICFVNQSHSGRLTKTEDLLVQTLSGLFGHKITQNIFIFATCADSTQPMFTRFMQSVGFQFHKSFKFSNTPFTIEHQMSRSSDQENDWDKGRKEIFDFFNILQKIHLSSFESFRANAETYEKRMLEYNAKRDEITDACYGLLNILNKNVVYDKIKEQSADKTYSTICNVCKRNCCSPCLASWINKRLCANINFFSGKCIPCPDTCKLSDHEYGMNIFVHAPRLIPQTAGTERVDSEVLTAERESIRTEGLNLLNLLKEATKLQNTLQEITKFGEKYSEKDLIDSFIKEKAAKQDLDWRLFVAIFEKCKTELTISEKDQWTNLHDFVDNV